MAKKKTANRKVKLPKGANGKLKAKSKKKKKGFGAKYEVRGNKLSFGVRG